MACFVYISGSQRPIDRRHYGAVRHRCYRTNSIHSVIRRRYMSTPTHPPSRTALGDPMLRSAAGPKHRPRVRSYELFLI